MVKRLSSELKSLALWLGLLAVFLLLPDRTIDPLGAINPRSIVLIVLLITGIMAVGHMLVRMLGARHGLPMAGFLSGFISSSATISVMGKVAQETEGAHEAAAAGAVLSTIATFIQLALLLLATNLSILEHLAPVLLAGGGASLLYGLFFIQRAHRAKAIAVPDGGGSSLGIKLALTFAAIVTLISVAVALLNRELGEAGVVLGSVVSGLADVHAATASLVTLVNSGTIAHEAVGSAIVAAITSNALTKGFLAYSLGSRAYAREVILGLVLVVLVVWGTALLIRV